MKIGILGGGQLGLMLAQAGQPLGHEFRFLDPGDAPCAAIMGEHVRGDYRDPEALARFAQGLDVITYEFENVPGRTARFLNERAKVHPTPRALRISQDRLAEKNFFRELGLPVPVFIDAFFPDEFDDALDFMGTPLMLKTRRMGYDGKGQRPIRRPEDAPAAYEALRGVPLILEELVPFDRELSIVATRDRDGHFMLYPVFENHHHEGILRLSLAPAPSLPDMVRFKAEECARRVLDELQYVGTLAIEFFQVDGGLAINEMAPRVHNSGHGTIDGCYTSQFENHIRAITGMPLDSADSRGAFAMINLIGEHPPLDELRAEDAHVYLYGKSPRPGRKIGHVTLIRDTAEELAAALRRYAGRLKIPYLRESLDAAGV